MTATAPAPGMVECRVCRVDVPAGEYCGLCGVPLAEHRSGDGPHWLRASSFSAAPGQRLLSPALTSSLFPCLLNERECFARNNFLTALLLYISGPYFNYSFLPTPKLLTLCGPIARE